MGADILDAEILMSDSGILPAPAHFVDLKKNNINTSAQSITVDINHAGHARHQNRNRSPVIGISGIAH